ncbi:hypothetical protein F2Q70_00005574 [Brassica cretica]|uniref:RING-type domain-containing protein n=1 Tax=Brassica cretica TaxID=69181 RepID=A0A8S9J091_BRACR|nr:hypothetical protein F2Q70_00005574 [Brassica cretica]
MEFLGGRDSDSDSEYAFRLQMEEALAASLASRSRAPPSPPVVARSGFAIVVEDEEIGSTPRGESENARQRNTGGGEGNSRGKGKTHHETVSGIRRDDRNPNSKVQNASAYVGTVTVLPAQSVGEGSSKKVVGDAVRRGSFRGDLMYRLYSKGLVSEETGNGNGKGKVADVVAGFGVAICDQRDALLFESKGQLAGRGSNRQGAEIQALTLGLTEASKLGIKHVAIFCDSFPIFQFVRGSWKPKQKKIAMLMDDLQRIRQQFSFTQAVLVTGNEVKYAYKLARESIVSQATPHENPRQAKVAARKEECLICFNDIDPERMFSIGKCTHRFCFQCVKQHVEVKLLHGMIPNCPHDKCKSEMVIDACGKLLTPKLGEMTSGPLGYLARWVSGPLGHLVRKDIWSARISGPLGCLDAIARPDNFIRMEEDTNAILSKMNAPKAPAAKNANTRQEPRQHAPIDKNGRKDGYMYVVNENNVPVSTLVDAPKSNGEADSSADEEQPANRRCIQVILSQQTLSSDDENDDTPVLEDLRDVLKRKFESENSNSSTRNDLRTTLNAQKSRRISAVDPDPKERLNDDLRDKLNA